MSSSYTLVTPAPGCAAVSDKTFKDFYEALDEFLPTARPQPTAGCAPVAGLLRRGPPLADTLTP